MQLNFATHFFQTLSFALLNSIWQMAILWFAFLIVNNKKEENPQLKYIFLVLIQVIGFGWFVQTFISAYENLQTVGSIFSISSVQINVANQILFYTGILYLGFVLYHMIQFLFGIRSIENFKQKSSEYHFQEYNLFIKKISTTLEIATNVCLKVSNKITSPLTIGVFKPIILIPFAAINSLSPTQIEAIILHELAHIKRKDYLINLLLLSIDVFMFFNPFSRLIKKQIFFEREICCDDIVLKYQYQKSVYVEALVTIASLQVKHSNSAFALNAVSSKNELLKRVQRIMGLENSDKSKYNKLTTFVIALLLGFLTLNISPTAKTQNVIAKQTFEKKSNNIFVELNIEKQGVKSKPIQLQKNVQVVEKKESKLENEQNSFVKNDLVETLNYFKPVENSSSHFAYQSIREENNANDDVLQEPILVTSAVSKFPIITTQKFFIPATSSKPASVIIVTTSENELGKKTVQIEIVKGTSAIE